MLHVLCLRNQPGIQNIRIRPLGDELLSLFEQPFHAVALLAPWALVQVFEDTLEALDLLARNSLVLGKGLLQWPARRGFDHAR